MSDQKQNPCLDCLMRGLNCFMRATCDKQRHCPELDDYENSLFKDTKRVLKILRERKINKMQDRFDEYMKSLLGRHAIDHSLKIYPDDTPCRECLVRSMCRNMCEELNKFYGIDN